MVGRARVREQSFPPKRYEASIACWVYAHACAWLVEDAGGTACAGVAGVGHLTPSWLAFRESLLGRLRRSDTYVGAIRIRLASV